MSWAYGDKPAVIWKSCESRGSGYGVWKNENIVIANVRMRLLSSDANFKKENFRRVNQQMVAVSIYGDKITMTNCDVYASIGGVSFGGDYIVFKDNILSSATCHHFVGRKFSSRFMVVYDACCRRIFCISCGAIQVKPLRDLIKIKRRSCCNEAV